MSKVTFGTLWPPTGLFTSESVADGHPDKICDQISDAILDAALAQDPNARVAAEAAIKGAEVWVFGEISGSVDLDIPGIVRGVIGDIGHAEGRWGLDPARLEVHTRISRQAAEIDAGVTRGDASELGAGDQGMMFGYAQAGSISRLPDPIDLAHQLMGRQCEVRGRFPALGPDAKAQVTVDQALRGERDVTAVVLSSQHAATLGIGTLRELIRAEVIEPVLGERLTPNAQVMINPAGPFTEGGPIADAGLTGRKIIVDTYGGFARHGGGAFSGKDATKVDRSGAYGLRQLARTLVDAGLASACELRIAYAIGSVLPVALHIDATAANEDLARLNPDWLADLMRPRAIIERLGLTRPIFRQTAAFGHFGNPDFPWETPLSLSSLEWLPT